MHSRTLILFLIGGQSWLFCKSSFEYNKLQQSCSISLLARDWSNSLGCWLLIGGERPSSRLRQQQCSEGKHRVDVDSGQCEINSGSGCKTNFAFVFVFWLVRSCLLTLWSNVLKVTSLFNFNDLRPIVAQFCFRDKQTSIFWRKRESVHFFASAMT